MQTSSFLRSPRDFAARPRKPPSLIRLLSKSHRTRIVASISSIASLDSRSGDFRRSDFMV